jgi:hypothetical protein
MSTRSATIIKDVQTGRCVFIARNSDGYPTGHGRELLDFLCDSESNEPLTAQALGLGQAAQSTGDITVVAETSCYDYVYNVIVHNQEKKMYQIAVIEAERILFSGELRTFQTWIAKLEKRESA